MPIKLPKDLLTCRKFFLEPSGPKHRQFAALYAYYVEELTAKEVAKKFGYTEGSFRQLLHAYVNDPDPQFFITPKHGPQAQPKKEPAREAVIALRKLNYSVYEIADALKEKGFDWGPTVVREILKEEGFAPLLRSTREERPELPRPVIEAVADVRAFSLPFEEFTTP